MDTEINSSAQKPGRVKWIDFMKAIAILAVLTDHSFGTLYSDIKITQASFFSVTLFILVSGINSYTAFLRHRNTPYGTDIKRKLKSILIPYGIATAVYGIIAVGKFDLMYFINSFLNFSSAAPFYFVVVFIQLLLISRFFCLIVNAVRESGRAIWQKVLFHLFFSVLLLAAAAIFTKYTFVLNVYIGGQFLFGGTYLFVYYIGHIIGSYSREINSLAENVNKQYIYIYIYC